MSCNEDATIWMSSSAMNMPTHITTKGSTLGFCAGSDGSEVGWPDGIAAGVDGGGIEGAASGGRGTGERDLGWRGSGGGSLPGLGVGARFAARVDADGGGQARPQHAE